MPNNRETEDSVRSFKINNDIMIGSFKGKQSSKGRNKTYFAIAQTQKKDEIPFNGNAWLSITEAKKLNKNLTKLITAAEV